MNTCWSRFRCAAVVGCLANTGGSLSLIFGAIGGAVCLPFFVCCSVVVFVSSRFRDDGCGGGPVPNEEEDKVVVCPKWGWWSFFLCRGGTPIVDCARPGRDCATRDFVELIVVLVAFVSVFVDISARIARSLDLVWFSRNAPLRLVFDRKRSEGDGEGPPRSRGGRRLFCVAAPKTVVVGPAARAFGRRSSPPPPPLRLGDEGGRPHMTTYDRCDGRQTVTSRGVVYFFFRFLFLSSSFSLLGGIIIIKWVGGHAVCEVLHL